MEINKEKMEEFLKLIEELVVNKIRIEKIQNETSELEIRRVLGQELHTVSKIQEVVKKIQTESMSKIYGYLEEHFGEMFNRIEISGADAEFDNYNENYIFNVLKILLNNVLESIKIKSEEKISIAARNDAANLIVEITSKQAAGTGILEKLKKQGSLFQVNDADIDEELRGVYAEIKKIHASLDAQTEGTEQKIILTVPLSSSIIKAQLVAINHQTFAIPMEYIEKVMNVNSADKRISNGIELINYMENIIPVIPIHKNLGYSLEEEFSNYVVLKLNNKMKVLPVNSLLEQTDVVVRAKPKVIQEIKEFKGMAILGDGDVTMVFDIAYMLGNMS